MFRDSEIIGLLNDLNKKLNCIQSKPEGELIKKLADIEDYCQEIRQKLETIEENCLRDDQEFRFQIKEAMKEYKEETELASYNKIETVAKARREVIKKKAVKKK